MRTLCHPALNGGETSDWLRPIPCQQEGDKLPKGAYQSDDGYSTGVNLPEHLAGDPSSRREASHVSSQGKEAVFVTHDIYIGRDTVIAFARLITYTLEGTPLLHLLIFQNLKLIM